ncbi:MAG: trigger factor [Candidatus Hydrogenedentes bacterium]|nr:trigger factor [Candidatus Hydrogenedentota bacterium]
MSDDEAKKSAKGDSATTTATESDSHEHDHAHEHEHDHEHGHHHHGHHHHHHDDEITFVEEPQFDVDYKGECAYEVKVTIPVANEKEQAGKMYDELADDAELPGFRKGKAPRRLIERKFAKAVRGEVDAKLVGAAFKKLVKDKSLKPIGTPDIEGLDAQTERKDDEPLSFTLKFEVSPRVELGKYRGIQVERPIVTIEDGDIDEYITSLRTNAAIFETLEGGVAADGDQVVIDFKGTIDGEAFAGGSAEKYPYVLGTKRLFPEFEQVLLGVSPGDETSCEVTFPEDYFNPQIQGKKASFAIKVSEVKRRNVPELTEDFAKQSGYESIEDLRAKVADQLRASSESQSDRIAENRALKAIIESSTFEIPKTVFAAVTQDVEEQEVRRLMSMRIPMDKIEEKRAEIHQRAEESALEDIKALTVLTEIGDAEGVEVTDEDFERELEPIAQRNRVGVKALAQYLEQEGQRNTYEGRVFRAKALAVVMQHAEVTNKEVPRDEIEAEAQSTQE